MNRIADYVALEREFVTSPQDISLRELARRHEMNHSLIVVAANKPDPRTGMTWKDKRAEYKETALRKAMDVAAASTADQEARVRSKALDVIERYIDKMDKDLDATEKRFVNGEWVDLPVMRANPQGLAALLDKAMILFNRPNQITEGRNINLSANASVEDVARVLELTQSVAGRDGAGTDRTALPRIESSRPN